MHPILTSWSLSMHYLDIMYELDRAFFVILAESFKTEFICEYESLPS